MSITRVCLTHPLSAADTKMGRTMLFFGCQYKSMDLYKTDKMEMIKEGVLNKTYLALSREPSIPKVGLYSNIDIIFMLKHTQAKLIVENGIISRKHPEYYIIPIYEYLLKY